MARTKRPLEIAATTTLGTLAAAAGAAATVWSFSRRVKMHLLKTAGDRYATIANAHRGLHDKTQGYTRKLNPRPSSRHAIMVLVPSWMCILPRMALS